MDSEDEWTAVAGNLRKVHMKWARLSRILVQEGVNMRESGTFLKVLVQVVLLFGLETWVRTPLMVWNMGGFQHMVVRRIKGR